MEETEKPPDPPGGGQLGEAETGTNDGGGGGVVTAKSPVPPPKEKESYSGVVNGSRPVNVDRVVKSGGRSWKQILEAAEKENILEMKFVKIADDEGIKPKNLTFDDIYAFVFDVLKIKYDQCLAFDYSSGRYDTRYIKLKPEVEPTPFLKSEPTVYLHHRVTVTSQNNKFTRVTFRNVPLNVPDEELLHLAWHYGTPVDNQVT